MLGLVDRSRIQGVCFFDEGTKAWMVLDHHGRYLPRTVSPVQESQALTLFDEARCRGADLQLRVDAVGLLTLSTTTCKDKLMQAVGRQVRRPTMPGALPIRKVARRICRRAEKNRSL